MTGNERECLRRDAVKPLGVVDKADQRLALRNFGKQAEHSQADRGQIRLVADGEPKSRRQRITLGPEQSVEMLEHGPAQLM